MDLSPAKVYMTSGDMMIHIRPTAVHIALPWPIAIAIHRISWLHLVTIHTSVYVDSLLSKQDIWPASYTAN